MIDAHLHLQDPVFTGRRDEILEELTRIGVSRLGVDGTSPNDWNDVAMLAEKEQRVVPFFGVHPWNVHDLAEGWEKELCRFLDRFPQSGVGEVGVDRWVRDHDIALQREILVRQLRIALDRRRPVALHCLRAWGHLLDCLDEAGLSGGFLVHSFGGPEEMVEDLVRRGAFFSISGYFFRPEKSEKLLPFESIPEHRILLETDAPSMALPSSLAPYEFEESGGTETINHPANILGVYRAYAEWRGRDFDELRKEKRETFDLFLSEGSREA